MHRIQIQLTAGQERALKEIARLRGVSISALVREGVDLLLSPSRDERDQRRNMALQLIGMLGPGGPSDVSERHDDYFAEAVEGEL